MIRNRISQEMKEAMRAREGTRLSTLRLINGQAEKHDEIAALCGDET